MVPFRSNTRASVNTMLLIGGVLGLTFLLWGLTHGIGVGLFVQNHRPFVMEILDMVILIILLRISLSVIDSRYHPMTKLFASRYLILIGILFLTSQSLIILYSELVGFTISILNFAKAIQFFVIGIGLAYIFLVSATTWRIGLLIPLLIFCGLAFALPSYFDTKTLMPYGLWNTLSPMIGVRTVSIIHFSIVFALEYGLVGLAGGGFVGFVFQNARMK